MEKSIILRAFILFTAVVAVFLYVVTLVGVNEIYTPVRVDSTYVKALQDEFLQATDNKLNGISPHFYYKPSDVGVKYSEITIQSIDSVKIHSWYIPAKEKGTPVVLVLHDLNQSRISLLPLSKQLYDRGFSVCIPDLRAHGSSEGEKATFGFIEKYDIVNLLDTLEKIEPKRNIVLFGLGMGSAIAIQTSYIDQRPKALILQSPFDKFSKFVKIYADRKWGFLNDFLFPLIRRELERNIEFAIREIDLVKAASQTNIPTLVIAGTIDKEIPFMQSKAVFDSTAALKKEFWLLSGTGHYEIEQNAGKKYYDKISLFIINSMEKKVKKTKYKKFV